MIGTRTARRLFLITALGEGGLRRRPAAGESGHRRGDHQLALLRHVEAGIQ